MSEPSSKKLSDIRHQRPSEQILALSRAMLLGFLLICLSLVYWGSLRADEMQVRDDNPRSVEAELRIHRGQILDRTGRILAETVGAEDRPIRQYPYPNSGPAVGYYSFRHGTSGIEKSYDRLLRGETLDLWSELIRSSLHRPLQGHDLQTTLDAEAQTKAEALLGSHTGAVVLFSAEDAEVIAMSSHPGYDPNQLDAEFDRLATAEDAPLLNRAIQGAYQPGLILQPFILAAAIDEGLIRLSDEVADANQLIFVNDAPLQCAAEPKEPVTWQEVLKSRCPAPLAELGDLLGRQKLETLFTAFGFSSMPDIPLDSNDLNVDPVDQPSMASIGQDTLTISPLQAGLAWLALTQGGLLQTPRLVNAVQDSEDNWQPVAYGPPSSVRAVSQSSARRVVSAMGTRNDVIEFSSLVLSGPEGNRNSWYLGLTPADSPRYAVVIIVESESNLSIAEQMGRQLLQAAIEIAP